MNFFKKATVFCGLLLSNSFLCMAGSTGVIASVNGTPITRIDVLMDTIGAERKMSQIYDGNERLKKINTLREGAIDSVIERTLIYQQYLERPFVVPAHMVEELIDRVARRFTNGSRDQLTAKIEHSGIPFETFKQKAKERVAVELLVNDQCFRSVYVTPREILQYYNSHKGDFKTSSRYKLQVISLSTKDHEQRTVHTLECENLLKTADDAQVKHLVQVYSSQHSDSDGVFSVKENEMDDDFKQSVVNSPLRTWKKIVKPEVTHFVRALIKSGGKQLSLEESQPQIELLLTRKQRDANYKRYISSLKRDAIISYYK